MGILSWFRSRWSADIPDDQPTLLRGQPYDPELEDIRRAAAADVAAVEEDDKYFGRHSPANRDDGF